MCQLESRDEKYISVCEVINNHRDNGNLRFLDVGCGKGRYIKKLCIQYPSNKFYGVDLSNKVLSYIKNNNIETKTSSILKIDHEDESFDIVCAAESLEHAILIPEAIGEISRVLAVGGTLIIIDKDLEKFEKAKYQNWFHPEELRTKQWIDKKNIGKVLENSGFCVRNISNLKAEDGLFLVCIATKAR